MKNKIFSLILSLLMLIPLFSLTASASVQEERIKNAMEEFLDPSGKIIGISSKGEWGDYPENSIPAIEEAAKTDIDFVLIDIKKTSDGVLIAFSDDTTERMLMSETVYNVSETDYSTLKSFYLRKGCGGSNEKASEYKIPTLNEVTDIASACGLPLIIRCEADLFPEISELLYEKAALDMSILMAQAGKKEISEAVSLCEHTPYIIGTVKGNVVFNIISFVNSLDALSAAGVQLKTVNRYGINYYKSLLSRYSEKMRVICDPTTPEESGYREDSEAYWNDLISRGYSVIITDHADIFSEYKKRADEARIRLQTLYDKYVTNHTLPDFRDEALNDTKKAYTDAVAEADLLLDDASASVQDLTDCYASLFKAANDVNISFSALEDGSAGTTVTLPRILLCIAAAMAVLVVQIYFFKRRRKAG
ncbi:MAG: hypothetical protein IJO68_07120 [Clostridia bacterium]|nr:hypothetical protein [Clostridia bacterium]